ncbi:MAG TPA: DctP family TRAP transporter solute-binding subunit [Brevibacterium sp.]|nr:DctP family TRAP transporter solute-binding subunit [Brevibacterium sp.]HLS32646.1 DctP family TRAP transporter solute-binding subunit [Brevibacterium sp.]
MNARTRRASWVAVVAAPALVLTGCGGGDSGGGESGQGGDFELTFATSYNEDQPQHTCGATVIEEQVESADVGIQVEIYPSSQLGGDAERISAVASGDIDMDIQGASALGAVYEPVSVLDAAYAFEDADHLAAFAASDEGQQVFADFAEASGVNTLGVWSAGARHFTSNQPITSPADLEGQRIRFPGSPQYLLNAEALGATATEVAYEELYLALQQGTVDGQENPITNIASQNLQEVQSDLSLTAHQLNTNLVLIGDVWNEFDEEQQQVVSDAVAMAVDEVTACVDEEDAATIEEWDAGDEWDVHSDVDVDAFREQAVSWFEQNLDEDMLTVFESIRATAP